MLVLSQPELMHAHDLALAHHHAAKQLTEIFACADLGEQPLDLPEAAIALHAPCIVRHLPYRFDIGRDPGEAMGRALLALERRAIDLAAGRDLGGNRLDRAVAQHSRGFGGGLKQWNELRRAHASPPVNLSAAVNSCPSCESCPP